MRALSVRQPFADLIMRGEKTIEARSLRTNIRGPVEIYASAKDVAPEDKAYISSHHHVKADELPRGKLIGTVEIVDCRPLKKSDTKEACFQVTETEGQYGWILAHPHRHAPKAPARHPQPVFFNPF